MDKDKSIIVILVAICLIMGTVLATLTIGNQHTDVVQVVNNTTANTTVEHINSEDTVNTVQKDDSASQSNDNGNNNMPEETRKIYAARQKAAEDGIPMYEYTRSPELVQKYQAMV
jgi:hypothetical protein